MHTMKRIIITVFFAVLLWAQTPFTLINPTYLGNEKRNYYGNKAPDRLDIIWKIQLGEGITKIGQKEHIWKGSGWTGQPLMVEENDTLFLIQGSFDHHLKKIYAANGDIKWEYEFPDAIKGTGTLWAPPGSKDKKHQLIIIQGSRRGPKYSTWSSHLHPLRAVSYVTGEEIWRYNVRRGASYSVDVDGSALLIDDIVYLGLENGYFVVFDPSPENTEVYQEYRRPLNREKHPLFEETDKILHGQNLITESSPSRLGNRIYIVAGSGHVYGYNLTTRKIDWDFYVGADMDGSPTVTYDNCILVSVEKEYIDGKGGVFKLDPSKPADSSCVVWYFSTENDTSNKTIWEGGVIGSASVNDLTRPSYMPHLAGFSAIDGYFYLVEHDKLDTVKVWGPNRKYHYPTPKFIASRWVGPGISTPLFVGNRMVVASYSGISLFEYMPDNKVTRLQRRYIGSVEATPFIFNKRIYVGSRDGYLYCLGEAEE